MITYLDKSIAILKDYQTIFPKFTQSKNKDYFPMKFIQLCLYLFLILTSCSEVKKNEKVIIPTKKIIKEASAISDTSPMIFFEGGTIEIGSNTGEDNQKPAFEMKIESFYLDKNLVTVSDFREFILKTGYVTDADKFGDSGVFLFENGGWLLLAGANWEFPLGKSKPKAIDTHPVTQVSWQDAQEYASWVGKRLPTEFEWEFAAKNGKNGSDKYAWGNSLILNDTYMANVWQGSSAKDPSVLDGYLLTSPVGTFSETKSGLTDMGGNVWQWCSNSYTPYPANQNNEQTDTAIKSLRGGSFMYDEALENSFTTTFRNKNSVDTSLFNIGFRCAK